MASENIYAQFVQPLRSVQDYANELDQRDLSKLRLEGESRKNMLAGLVAQQQQQSMADGQRSKSVIQQVFSGLAPDAAPDARIAALRRTGDRQAIELADAQEKQWLDRRKTESEAGAKDVDTENKVIGTYRDLIGNAANPQQAAQYVQIMHSDPRLKSTAIARVPLDQALSQIGGDPQTFQQWKQQFALGAAKFVEMNKPQYITQNLGGNSRITAVPGLGVGPAVTASEAPITQSADNAATQATARANQARMSADAAAGRTQSASQFSQRLAYDREKDATTAAGGGNITEGERNAGGYASRMVEASKLLDQFEGKGRATYKTDTLGGVPLVGRALQTSAMSAEQQQYRQAQEDWVRAKLRKESGASIAPDEMAREISAYFPEPGDKPENIAQKKQARDVANRAMVQSAGRGAPKAAAAPAPGAVLKFDAQGNPVK